MDNIPESLQLQKIYNLHTDHYNIININLRVF